MSDRIFGLLGYPLSHSFSKEFFTNFFRENNINAEYYNYESADIEIFFKEKDLSEIEGLNITIPYKEKVIKYLDKLDISAQKTGSVNVIKIINDNNKYSLLGFNTDIYGFENSLKKVITPFHNNALIIGTGGSSKSVQFVLEKLGISLTFVSREKTGSKIIGYQDLNSEIINKNKLIINTSPLGMFPDTESFPAIPFEFIGKDHLLFDLIYNPEETLFLKKGKENGATVKNGIEMLEQQALKAWEIWNS
jgi:shikimate dehydrogenase